MLSHEELQKLLDAKTKVFGSDGEKIGTLGHIYLDDGTGIPDFITVHTGFLGASENFVPLNGAEISDGQLYVKFPKSVVKDAPNIDPAGDLGAEDEDRLYYYYSRLGAGSPQAAADPAPPRVNEVPDVLAATSPLAQGQRAVRDDLAPVRPLLRKHVSPEPGTPKPGPESDTRSGERLEAEDVDAEVGGTPRGQTPEEPPKDNSERAETMRSGGTNTLDP
ncbi:PRC-barrel domain-containing protein [Paeniglutamicibacter kerguelensis]|uniref:PRC-barrel domain-containing protein n=1 Tax=Paeniglutamicibacter kerguelensis TaxID=254788 RepID=A0ABS4XD80_9MICC|nr:PRC-barrel domain-containing protein [Paeniglutamicibacter kerguelensis]MBP2386246.1 hypothetical protein [Paeniglutamicibacter kerguelensis]